MATAVPAAGATVATPTAREWDAQSLHADSASPFFPPVGAGMGSSGSPGATVELLRDLVQKRIITLTYMRNVHDGYVSTRGCVYFAHSHLSFLAHTLPFLTLIRYSPAPYPPLLVFLC
jgi:hypothetical protein